MIAFVYFLSDQFTGHINWSQNAFLKLSHILLLWIRPLGKSGSHKARGILQSSVSTNNGKFRNAALIVLLLMQNEVKGKL